MLLPETQAVLFDCWPIISRDENGGDDVDFPIPAELKVDPLDTDALLNIMMTLAATDRDRVKEALAPFLRQVLDEPRLLLNNVARTFESRSVQFIVTEEVAHDDEMMWVSMLSIFEAWPLASVTLVLRDISGDASVPGTTRLTNKVEKIETNYESWEVRRQRGEARRNTFQRRWALRLRALSDRLGLTDMSGGQDYHSLRIRSEAEMPPGTKGVPNVNHGDFVIQWGGPVVVVDKEQATQEFAEMVTGRSKNDKKKKEKKEDEIDGLWSIGGGGNAAPSGAGCRALQDLAKNDGWRAAGFGTILDRSFQRVCLEMPTSKWSAWIETFAQTHGVNTARDGELVVGLVLDQRRRRHEENAQDLVMLDVGSNVGLFSTAFISQSEESGVRTIAHLFEPSWEMHHEGKRRLSSASSSSHQHQHHNFGLSDRKTTAVLIKNRDDNPGWNGLAEEHDPLTPVRVGKWWQDEVVLLETLDGVWHGGRVDVIKIDVEGHEASVLRGAMETIAMYKPMLYIEVAWGTAHPAWESRNRHVYAELEEIGYVLIGEHHGHGMLVTDRSKIAGLETSASTRNLVFASGV